MSQLSYEKPPIVEAILDLRIRWKEPFDIEQLKGYKSLISDTFPIASPIHFLQVSVGAVSPDGQPLSPMTTPTEIGVRFANAKNDRVLQIQQGGFTFSHLAPYSKWEVMRNEAMQLWARFSEHCAPFVVTRCAVRFINRITIPEPSIELFDYFHLYPHIPDGIHQNIGGMLVQLQMPQPDLGASTAVINLALAEPEKPLHTTVLLDIDLFSPLENVEPDSKDIWTAFDLYRTRKNDLFEAFITDKTRRLFS